MVAAYIIGFVLLNGFSGITLVLCNHINSLYREVEHLREQFVFMQKQIQDLSHIIQTASSSVPEIIDTTHNVDTSEYDIIDNKFQ